MSQISRRREGRWADEPDFTKVGPNLDAQREILTGPEGDPIDVRLKLIRLIVKFMKRTICRDATASLIPVAHVAAVEDLVGELVWGEQAELIMP